MNRFLENRLTLLSLVILMAASDAAPLRAQGLTTPTAEWMETGPLEIPFEYHRRFMVVEASVNGSRPLRMIFDSGAPVMLIASQALADSLDLNVLGAVQVQGAGDGPAVSAPLATGVQFDIGGLRITDDNLISGLAEDVIRGLDGVLGGSVFGNAVVEMDWDRKLIRLHRPETFTYSGSGHAVDLTVLPSGHAYLTGVDVSPVPGDERRVNLHLDTGFTGGLALRVPTNEVPQPAVGGITAWGTQGAEQGQFARVHALHLGDSPLHQVVAAFPSSGPEDLAGGFTNHGMLGLRVLERFTTWVDYSRGRVIFEPNARFSEAFSFHTVGLRLQPWVPDSVRLTVAHVIEGSPADRAGVRQGDVLLAVDGKSVGEWTPDDLAEVWERTPGSAVELTLERDGERETLRIVTARIL